MSCKPGGITSKTLDCGKPKAPAGHVSDGADLHRYRRLFETLGDGVVVADASNGKIIDVNPSVTALLGLARQQLLGRRFEDLLSEADARKWRAALEGAVNTNHVWLEGLRLETQQRGPVLIECGCCLHPEGDQQVLQCVIRDITSRAEAERQLKQALREKEVLLKEVHHRVKNNLQIIHSLLSLQARYIKDEKTLDIYRDSQNRVRSMALIHEEIYRSKDFINIDFTEYLRKLSANLFRTYGIDPNALAVRIDADNMLLSIDSAIPCGLIVGELLSNALKYAFPSGRKGEVQVEMRREADRRYTLAVRDNGIGLPAGLDFRKTETLGLQLVVTLAEQLGAEIEAHSDGGTEFVLRFAELEYPKRG